MSTTFPKWMNALPAAIGVVVLGGVASVIGGVWYYFTPKYWEVGYMPEQPGAGFSHQIHVGKLGMDCRYCHTHVEESPEANIPNVSTCMGCHTEGRVRDTVARPARVQFIRDAYAADASIEWRRVHKLPDYVRNFPHHVHVQAGVSCYSCHGQIARMAVVEQREPLSMGWCLECHRNPEPHLVPPEKVTDLFWVEEQLSRPNRAQQAQAGRDLLAELAERPLHRLPENCGACHY